jgi:hypothetical protein
MDPLNKISNSYLLYQPDGTGTAAQDSTKTEKVKIPPKPHPKIDEFNNSVLGSKVSDEVRKQNDAFVKWSFNKASGDTTVTREPYEKIPLGLLYVPSSVISRLVPSFVSKAEIQPVGNTVMNTANNGTENQLVNKNYFSLEFGTNLNLPKVGLLNALSVNIDRSDLTNGGSVGTDRNIGMSWQTLIPEKNTLDRIFPPISKDPLFSGKEWYQQPGEALRSVWRAPSFLKEKVEGLSGGWQPVGMLADIPLTVIKFVAEDIPNSFIGGNIRYSFVNNNERVNPSFYDPSVKTAGFGADMYWSLGRSSFITTSYDHSWGTKEYTLGLPHNSDDQSWKVRFDAPNLLGESWGIPFLTLHPWAEYRKGQDQLQVSSGTIITTTATDPITAQDTTSTLPGNAGKVPIAYSILSGGVNAYICKDLELGVALSKETREMQRDRQTVEYHITYGPATFKYSQVANPIMYYDQNTNLPENQNKFEFEFDPKFFAGNAAQFLPSVFVGTEKTWADNGSLRTVKDNFTYFGIKYSLGLSGKKQKKSVSNYGNELFINTSDVPHIVGNNKYSWDAFLMEKILKDLDEAFEKALTTALGNMLTETEALKSYKDAKRMDYAAFIKDFKAIVKQKGLASDEAIAKKDEIDKYIKELSTIDAVR